MMGLPKELQALEVQEREKMETEITRLRLRSHMKDCSIRELIALLEARLLTPTCESVISDARARLDPQ